MVFRLSNKIIFPDPALADEDGLLAVGGDLSEERLMLAYSLGIFPWYSEGEPILWYSPHQRFVIEPDEVHISRSMHRTINSKKFEIKFDAAFEAVIRACASSKRGGQHGTWITKDMKEAYIHLHKKNIAHSIEVWAGDELAGGLYGVAVGRVFCAESMFSKHSNTSKLALIALCRSNHYELIDCQVYSAHVESMGAKLISRSEFDRFLHGTD